MSLFRKPSDPLPSVFPTYLLSSLPFRRSSRQSSTDSNASTSTTTSTTSPPSHDPFTRPLTPIPAPLPHDEQIIPPTDKYLSPHATTSTLSCASPKCTADLALTSQIISKGFMGRHGRAYLVQGAPLAHSPHMRSPSLPNTYLGKAVTRNLVTGQHMVSDLSCAICGVSLGWKYVEASEESQRYKVGKFILETKRVRIGVRWDVEGGDEEGDGDGDLELELPPDRELRAADEGELEFDSQDEDECEDLFAGVWSPALAARRRTRKSERYRRKAARVFVPPATRSNDSLV